MFKPNQYLSSLQITPQIPICIIKSVLDFLLLNWTIKDDYTHTVFSKQARLMGKTHSTHLLFFQYINSVSQLNKNKLDNSLTLVLST